MRSPRLTTQRWPAHRQHYDKSTGIRSQLALLITTGRFSLSGTFGARSASMIGVQGHTTVPDPRSAQSFSV